MNSIRFELTVLLTLASRSTKWLYEINVLPEPSMGPVQRQECEYMIAHANLLILTVSCLQTCTTPNRSDTMNASITDMSFTFSELQVGKQNVTYDKGFSIQDMPVSSAILSPKDKEVIVHDGFIHCEGFVFGFLANLPASVEAFSLLQLGL